jgi:hypothetical protein
MKDGLQDLIDGILENELQYINRNVNALLLPQSTEAIVLHSKYLASTENDQTHNYNMGSLTLGEIEEYSIEEIDVPSFEQFIVKNLTEHGYSKSRFDQILLNNRSNFVDLDITPFDPIFNKFEHELKGICQTSKVIAAHFTSNQYNLAKDEFNALKVRFPSFFPPETGSLIDKLNTFFAKHQFLIFILALLSIVIGIISIV